MYTLETVAPQLDALTLKSDSLEIKLNGGQSTLSSDVSSVLSTALEKPKTELFAPLVVPMTA